MLQISSVLPADWHTTQWHVVNNTYFLTWAVHSNAKIHSMLIIFYIYIFVRIFLLIQPFQILYYNYVIHNSSVLSSGMSYNGLRFSNQTDNILFGYKIDVPKRRIWNPIWPYFIFSYMILKFTFMGQSELIIILAQKSLFFASKSQQKMSFNDDMG